MQNEILLNKKYNPFMFKTFIFACFAYCFIALSQLLGSTTVAGVNEGTNFTFQLPAQYTQGNPFDSYTILNVIVEPGTGSPGGSNPPGQFKSDDLNNWNSGTGLLNYTSTNLDWFGELKIEWRGVGAGFNDINNTVANGGDYIIVPITSTNDDPTIRSGSVSTSLGNTASTATYSVSEKTRLVAYVEGSDVDGDTIAYTLSGTHAAYFEHDAATKALEFISSSGFDYELPVGGSNNSYSVTVNADDQNGGAIASQTITVNVTNVNESPIIQQGNDDIVLEISEDELPISWEDATTSTGYRFTAVDPDAASTFTWSIFTQAVNGTASIDSQNDYGDLIYTPNADMWGEDLSSTPAPGETGIADKFTVRVTDNGNPAKTDDITVRVKIAPVDDDAPVIDQNSSITINENDTTPISLTVVDYDQGFSPFWEKAGGADATKFNIDPNTGDLTIPSPDDLNFEGGGDNNYSLTVRVTDDTGLEDTIDLNIIIQDVNEAPVIDQGDSVNVIMDEDGTPLPWTSPVISVQDPDDNSTPWGTLRWSIVAQATNGTATIADPNLDPPTILYVPHDEYSGADSFTVKVNDKSDATTEGFSDTIVVNVTIAPSDDPPDFTSLGGVVDSPENQPGAFIFSATDRDGGSISYSIFSGNDKDFFIIDPSTGKLEFNSTTLPNFENPADHDFNNTYEVTVAATDANGSSYQDLIVTVGDSPERANFTSPNSFSVDENQQTVGTVSVSDPDLSPETHTFSIVPQDYLDDADAISVDSTSGVISFINNPDFEANASMAGNNLYNFIIRVTDSRGAINDQNVTVQLQDANDQPSLSTGTNNNALIQMDENTTIDSPVYLFEVFDQDTSQVHNFSLSGVDSSFFEVVPNTGELILRKALDFETPLDENEDNKYDLTVTATDNHIHALTSQDFEFQVQVVDVDEGPFLAGDFSTSITVIEDNASSFVSPSWVAIDPETNSSNNISWSLIDSNGNYVSQVYTTETNSSVSIAPLSGLLTFIPSPNSNKEMNGTDLITVICTDSGGNHASQMIEISILAVNDAPTITVPFPFTGSITHPEGDRTVIDFNGSDEGDKGTNNIHFTEDYLLQWSISGLSADAFEINNLGVLSFKATPVYDGSVPANNRYEITVSVADEHGGRSDYNLVINVANSPEKPVLMTTLSTVQISEDADPVSWEDAWSGIEVVDPDSGSLTWSISDEINATLGTASVGQFDGNIFYQPDANRFGRDEFKVNVTDDDNLTLGITIEVNILPVNDAPLISDSDSTGYPNQVFLWTENTPAITIIKSFESNDSHDYEYSSLPTSTNWDVRGIDGELFAIDQNGSISFKRSPDFEAPADENSDNLYEVLITATDDSAIYREYPLGIRVTNARDLPIFTSLDGAQEARVSVSENSTFVYQASAEPQDVNSDEIEFEIGGGVDQSLFSINRFTGGLNFKQAPDYESPDDNNSDNQYEVVIIANDGADSNQTVTVIVEDVNEAPVFDNNITAAEHNEMDGTFSMEIFDRFEDPEKNSSQYIYSLVNPDVGDNQFFTINSSTGLVTFNDFVPDYENPQDESGQNLYTFTVQVEDGTSKIIRDFTLKINNSDDLPQIDAAVPLTNLSAQENHRFVASLTALDQDIANSFPDIAYVVSKESLNWVENNETAGNRFLAPNEIANGLTGASFCVTGDFNRDGALDIIILEKSTDSLKAFQNNGAGNFEVIQPLNPPLTSSSTPTYAVTADFNEDGFLDLAVVLQNANEVRILLNRGTSDIAFEQNYDIDRVQSVSYVDVGDIDMDGDQDVLLICLEPIDGNQTIKWFANDGPLYYENDSSPLSFSAGATLEFDIRQINTAQSASLGDIDRDGDMDLAVASSQDGNFSLFLNDGNGSFASPILLYKQLGGQAHGVQLVDLNQDNNLDVIVTTKSPNQLGVILQNFGGGGEFQFPTFFYQSDSFVNDFDLGDLDKDGDLDIVAASSADSKIRWFVNNINNNGEFLKSDEYITDNQEGIVSISVGDMSLQNAVLEFDIVNEVSDSIKDDDKFVFRPQFSGHLYFKEAPDFDRPAEDDDANYQYEFKVIVQDRFKPESNSTRNVAVSLSNSLEPPVIDYPTAGGALQLTIKEHTTFVVDVNSTNDEELYEETRYSISGGADQAYFAIDEITGVLSFTTGPDYENPLDDPSNGTNNYDVIVRATDDGKGDPPFSERVMRIRVENDNDVPVINALPSALSNTLDEDSSFSLLLSDLNASDPEGGPLSWSCISDPEEGNYSLDSTALVYQPNPNFFGVDQITLRLEDNVSLFADVSIEFIVLPVNDAPSLTTALSIDHPENEMDVITLAADDIEGDVLTWSLIGGGDQTRFQLSNNGMLSFIGNAPDFENPDSNDSDLNYEITISVTDGNKTVDQNLTITTTNIPDVAPEVSNLAPVAVNTFTVVENNSYVMDLNVSDIEDDNLTISISGGEDRDSFELFQSGTLQFRDAPDFENPTDNDQNNIYLIDVNITDGVNPISRSIAVQVVNANPVLTKSHFIVQEDTETYLEPEAKDETQSLTLESDILINPVHGRIDSSNGQFLYIPNKDYVGPDSFQLLVIDDQKVRHELNATIDVVDQPDPPIAVDDLFYYTREMGEGITITVDQLLENDSTEPDQGESLVHQAPGAFPPYSQGLLSFDSAAMSYNFKPASNFIGPFEFTYKIYDGDDIEEARVTIVVESAPDLDPWKYVHGFGYFMYMEASYPWIMHGRIGWVYISVPEGERTATWMWNEKLGWVWTGADYFPHFFSQDLDRWFYLEGGLYEADGVGVFDFETNLRLEFTEFEKKRIQAEYSKLSGKDAIIDFVASSSFFSTKQKQQIISELYFYGSSPILSSLIK